MAINPRIAPLMRRVNPAMTKFAARVPPWVTLDHVGRKSGRTYTTPLVAFAVRDPEAADVHQILVAFPLPWGPDTDWARNVLHAGRCEFTRRGVRYQVTDPHVVDLAEAARLGVRVAAAMEPAHLERQFLVGAVHRAVIPEL
ncbi:MAG: hypothetical protein FWF90_18470 [Promicromonosporaceae bacterium]|nr:hypothetical protein [Promicromonosporaceae bacterium]